MTSRDSHLVNGLFKIFSALDWTACNLSRESTSTFYGVDGPQLAVRGIPSQFVEEYCTLKAFVINGDVAGA